MNALPPRQAMLLCAGKGTRLGAVTKVWPKPTIPFLNVPLMLWPLALLKEMGIERAVINWNYRRERFAAAAAVCKSQGIDLNWSHEHPDPLESGGGLVHARALLDEEFWLANGDEILLPHSPLELAKVLTAHRREKNLMTLAVLAHPQAGSKFGAVWCDSSGLVRGFGRRGKEVFASATDPKDEKLQPLHYIGFAIVRREILDYLPPTGPSNLLYDGAISALRENRRIGTVMIDAEWFETGNTDDFLDATRAGLAALSRRAPTSPEALAWLRRMVCHWRSTPQTFWQTPGGIALVADSAQMDQPEIQFPVANSSAPETFRWLVAGDDCRIHSPVFDAVVLPETLAKESERGILFSEQ